MVTYTLTLSNLGDAPTTVDLTFAGNVWDVSLPETSFDLGIGEIGGSGGERDHPSGMLEMGTWME